MARVLCVLLCVAAAGVLNASYTASTITKETTSLDLSASAGATNRTAQFVPFATSSGYAAADEGKLDNVPIGFSFTFFGASHTTVDISPNCFLSFEDIDIATHGIMPNVPGLAQRPNNFIMCAANDYGFLGAVPGTTRLFTETIGSAPNREFRVQWKGWVAIIGGDPVDVICRLFETSNRIEVHAVVGSGGTLGNGRVIAGLEGPSGTQAIPCLEGWTQGQYPANGWRWDPKSGAEIELYRPSGVNLPKNFQHDMEDRHEGTSFTNTYTIRNAGDSNLVISSPISFVAGATNCTGQVLTQPASFTLAPGGTETFTVQVTPTSAAAGFFLATFRILSNDTGVGSSDTEATFNFFVAGTAVAASVPDLDIPPAPGIVLTYDALAGGRLFHEMGRLVTGTTYTFTYTIYNTAAGTLNLTGTPNRVTISASNAVTAVTQQPPASIAGFGSATFTVTVQPTGGDIFGGIGVQNDDPWSIEAGWGNILVGYGVNPVSCEIDLQRPAGTSIASGGSDPFGTVAAGQAQNRTYTVANTGAIGLSLTGTPLVVFQSLTNCTAMLVTAPAAFVQAASTTTFQIAVTPGAGAFSCVMVVPSNDSNENPYVINLSGTGTAPSEIDVQRPAGTSIADGGTDTVTGASAGTPVVLTYTVANTGTGTLLLTGPNPVSVSNLVNISGSVSITQPASLSIAPAGSTTFTATFTPLAAGTFGFDLDLLSNDSDEANYDILVTGAASEADIDVRNPGGSSISSGGTDTYTGSAAGVAENRPYAIHSVGGATLLLTGGSPVSVGATTNITGAVAITQPGTGTLAPGTNTTFALDFTPTNPGTFTIQVSVASNDPNENPFTFTISGSAAAPAPEISLLRGTTGIADQSVDFLGSAFSAGVPAVLVYTIQNTGSAPLNLTGTPLVQVSSAFGCSAQVTLQPATVVGAGSVATFEITVTPGGGGFSFVVDLPNDDADEGAFQFSASGTATGAFGGGGGGGSGGGGGCTASPGASMGALVALPLLLRLRRRRLQE